MKRLMWCVSVVALLGLVVGCAPETGTGNDGVELIDSENGLYRLALTFDPSTPVPDRVAVASVLVTQDGLPLDGAGVAITVSSPSQSFDPVGLVGQGDGRYSGEMTLAAGAWELTVSVEPETGEGDSADYFFIITCVGGGESGSVCCAQDDCGGGLSCVHGACAAELAPEGLGCYGAEECQTGNCEARICMPEATCEDGRINGEESDRDCGGLCGPCPEGAQCGSADDCGEGTCVGGVCTPGLPLLGNGTGSIDQVEMVAVSGPEDGHRTPTDLAFHPSRTQELWVLSQDSDSMWIGTGIGTPDQSGRMRSDPTGAHFMVKPSALAFGDKGCTSRVQNQPSPVDPNASSFCMATIHEEDQPTPFTNNAPGQFMGPTLWTADSSRFDAGHASHYDMLHNSPNGMGIAWETGNTYWVFDGFHGAITRFEFSGDHGPGGQNHDDGIVDRYVEGQVSREAGVPSHMVYDRDTGLLYIADTGNNRIAVLDTTTGTRGRPFGPNFDNTRQSSMDGATLETLVEGSAVNMIHPSGLELHEGTLYVTDNKTSTIFAFTLEGEPIDSLNTELPEGALMGIAFDTQGRLLAVDAVGNQVWRISPR